ncbi:Uncharacterised protein [Raoultella ornithinolytica]|nr:Uncharacterised protein [Raoultella ornithinolytica]
MTPKDETIVEIDKIIKGSKELEYFSPYKKLKQIPTD